MKEWIDFKFRKRDRISYTPTMKPDDLIFTRINFTNGVTPKGIYSNILGEFHKILKTVGMDEYKEDKSRRKITLGHSKSSYWTLKEPERREIYATKIMKYLTFLDYSGLEASGKSIESQLVQKDREITYLRERDLKHEIELKAMNDRFTKIDGLVNKIEKLEKEIGIKI